MVTRRWVDPVLPVEQGVHRGLAFSLWRGKAPRAGVVILHGAGSVKESHYDFARAGLPLDFAALAYDARGHGESAGALDGRAIDDVAAMADRLRAALPRGAPVALRGSSMGGTLALLGASEARASAVVAIAPAPVDGLMRAIANHRLDMQADAEELRKLLRGLRLDEAVAALHAPILIQHADGDERVPVQGSRELEPHLTHPLSRLIVVPGGHHRSVQHDPELQAQSLRFLRRALL